MTEPQSTAAQLIRFLQEELLDDAVDLSEDDDLLADDMIDSLGMVQLVDYIEQELGIAVPPEDFVFENFQTVRLMSQYLQRRQNGSVDGR